MRTLLRGVADRLPPYTVGWLRARLLRAGGWHSVPDRWSAAGFGSLEG